MLDLTCLPVLIQGHVFLPDGQKCFRTVPQLPLSHEQIKFTREPPREILLETGVYLCGEDEEFEYMGGGGGETTCR